MTGRVMQAANHDDVVMMFKIILLKRFFNENVVYLKNIGLLWGDFLQSFNGLQLFKNK